MQDAVLLAALATGFTFLMTTLGSAVVFLFKNKVSDLMQKIFFGFAGGVMIAASVFSLLIPAIEEERKMGNVPWIPASGGFAMGAAMLILFDVFFAHMGKSMQQNGKTDRKSRHKFKKNAMLISAITIHNIPEGMSVGLLVALAVKHPESSAMLFSAIILAVGIGVQNFPEGAAISLPLRQNGMSSKKAFLVGMLSGIVEPVFGILTVLAASLIAPVMPWLLSFAAGSMVYVVFAELIQPSDELETINIGTLSVIIGFTLMMVLDVALG